MRMRPRRSGRRLLAAGFVIALTVAACGGNGDVTDDADEPADVDESEAEPEDDAEDGDPLSHNLPTNMEIATSPVGGAFYVSGSAMAPILEEELGSAVTATVTGGSGENIFLLADGDVDMAIITLGTIGLAAQGIGEAYEREYSEFRSLGYLWTHPQVWIALEDAPYDSVADLQDARVAVGTGPATWDHLTAPLLEAHGIDYDELDKVYAGFNDMFASVGDGRVDASITLLTGGAALMPAAEELAFQQDVKYLTMDPDSIAEAVENTSWYFPAEIDVSLLPGFEGDSYPTFDQGGVHFLVTDAMSDEDAYALTAALHRAIERASEDVPFLRAAAENPDMIVQEFEHSPFHPGAIQYWQDAGVMD